mgnify:CR=1 FL=1
MGYLTYGELYGRLTNCLVMVISVNINILEGVIFYEVSDGAFDRATTARNFDIREALVGSGRFVRICGYLHG